METQANKVKEFIEKFKKSNQENLKEIEKNNEVRKAGNHAELVKTTYVENYVANIK
jgi:hypothetical protein